MKRMIKLVLLAVMVLAVALPVGNIFAQGDDELPIAQGTVNQDDGTGIYAEPDINSEIVGRLDGGETVLIYEEDGLFVRIADGYVVASALDIGAAQVYLKGVANTTSDFAIRAEPSISGDVLATLPTGSVVGVLEIDGRWVRVFDGDHLGYSFLADLDLSDADVDVADLASSPGTASTNSAVAIRETPEITGEPITTVEDGSSLQVLAYDESGRFAFVRADDGTTGWAFVINLDISPRGVARGTFNQGPVNFLDAPTADATILNYLPFNGNVLVLGRSEDGDFLKVRYPGPVFIDTDGDGTREEVQGAEGWVNTLTVDIVAPELDVESLPVVEE
jgi:hypothetical protein